MPAIVLIPDFPKAPGEEGNVVHPNPQRRLAKFDARREAAWAKQQARKAKVPETV